MTVKSVKSSPYFFSGVINVSTDFMISSFKSFAFLERNVETVSANFFAEASSVFGEEINIISDDVSIKLIKNGENVVTKYDSETHTYKEYISADTEQVSLSIEANNQYTTLKSGETEGKPQISINNIFKLT